MIKKVFDKFHVLILSKLCYNLFKFFLLIVKFIYREESKMGKVTKDMGILDIVQQYPEAV